LIPGAGGTQRLPRLVGLSAAIDLIASGEPLAALQAAGIGLIDKILPEPFAANAISFAMRSETPSRKRWAQDANDTKRLLDEARDRFAESGPGGRAIDAALLCLEAASRTQFEEGMRLEHEQVMSLIGSAEAQALRQKFLEKRTGGRTC
jgi:3-hydroxyacyl-CoA dehydrogenase